MNILLSMPNDQQSNSYIINALQDMGHKVVFLDHRTNMKHCQDVIPQIMKVDKIDLFLVLYLVPTKTYDVAYLRFLKTNFPNVKYLSWVFDVTMDNELIPDNENLIEIIKEYDYFFTVCDGQVEKLRDKGINAFWLHEGATRYTFDLNHEEEKIIDVCFIGQVGHPKVHQGRLPLLKRISERFSNTVIFGPLFTQDEEILHFHAFRPTYNDIEHARMVAKSKVNLSHSGWGDVNHYFSARTYRIMSQGGFVLANHSEGIEDMFKVGEEIATYTDSSDCIEKIKYYLKNDEEREAIAKAGQKAVLEKYTFNHCMIKMLKIIEEN